MSALRAALVALSATVLTAACAAGQHAQTAEEKSVQDATSGHVAQLQLEGVALQAPKGPSYPKGAAVPLTVYLVNNGQKPDSLTKISSNSFTGWSVVPTSAAGSAPSSSSGTASSGSSATPQKIGPGAAVGYGLQNLSSSGAGSSKTILLQGNRAPLFPGVSVKVTFTFAQAGETTLTVPVAVSTNPNTASLPGGSDASETAAG